MSTRLSPTLCVSENPHIEEQFEQRETKKRDRKRKISDEAQRFACNPALLSESVADDHCGVVAYTPSL